MDIKALYDLSYGVYVIGALDETRPVGCVANAAMQITAEPMTLAVSLNKDNYTENAVRRTGYFTVSILSEETSAETIGKFGFQSSKDVRKFEGTSWKRVGDAGLPVLDDNSCSWVLCKVIKEVDVFTHTIFIGEILDMERFSEKAPMSYAYYHKVKKGKTAKNAPTYLKEAEKSAEQDGGKWVCSICGYVFDGDDAAFAALPEDWTCPICKVPKSMFRKQ